MCKLILVSSFCYSSINSNVPTKFVTFTPVICKEINPSAFKNITFWSLNQSIMFLESYQQIPYKLNPATKHNEAKILIFIWTFKLLMEVLQFLKTPLSLFEGTKIGTDATKQQNTGRDATSKEEFKVIKRDNWMWFFYRLWKMFITKKLAPIRVEDWYSLIRNKCYLFCRFLSLKNSLTKVLAIQMKKSVERMSRSSQ